MRKSKIIIAVFLIILIAIAFLFQKGILNVYSLIFWDLHRIEKMTSDFIAEEMKKEVFTPPPLRSNGGDVKSVLRAPAVIEWTNKRRQENNLPPLVESEKLDVSAAAKVKDLFDKQYFEHVSPDGVGVKDLVRDAGYDYIIIGENLALGNFKDDEALVDAWMNSPGHRANILNTRYKEIGVAVGMGNFEGKKVWIAVQHFGSPLSSCPQPDKNVLVRINANEATVNSLKSQLDSLKIEIDRAQSANQGSYRKKVEQYNSLVEQYNNLINTTKKMMNDYNAQVKAFNDCATG